MLPPREIHVREIELNLTADFGIVRIGQVGLVVRLLIGEDGGDVGEGRIASGFLIGVYLGQRLAVVVREAAEGETKGLDRAFEAFEQIDRHQRLDAFFAASLLEVPVALFFVGVVERLILRETAGLHVTQGSIDRQGEGC